MNKLIKDLKML